MLISWLLDGDNRLESVGLDWWQFAESNAADPGAVTRIGQPLAGFIGDPTLVALWTSLLRQVRQRGEHMSGLRYRCDSPWQRRLFEATLVPHRDGSVNLFSHVLVSYGRPEVRILDRRVERDFGEMIRICSWCERMWADEWVSVEEGCRRYGLLACVRPPMLSHGVCDDCVAGFDRQFDLELRDELAG